MRVVFPLQVLLEILVSASLNLQWPVVISGATSANPSASSVFLQHISINLTHLVSANSRVDEPGISARLMQLHSFCTSSYPMNFERRGGECIPPCKMSLNIARTLRQTS